MTTQMKRTALVVAPGVAIVGEDLRVLVDGSEVSAASVIAMVGETLLTEATKPDRRLSQEQLRAQARTDGIVQERRGRAHNLTPYKQVDSKDPALKRLQDWANADEDRVFEIRYITMAPYPWGVDLSNDSVSWAVHVDCHDSLEKAVDWALVEAASEERT